jgi:transcriptional regulator with XRE-family HTH domain
MILYSATAAPKPTMMKPAMSLSDMIGFNIRNLRKTLDLKRDDFAEKIGIEGGHLHRIEKGLNMPGSLIIIKLCKEFNVSSDELLGLSTKIYREN